MLLGWVIACTGYTSVYVSGEPSEETDSDPTDLGGDDDDDVIAPDTDTDTDTDSDSDTDADVDTDSDVDSDTDSDSDSDADADSDADTDADADADADTDADTDSDADADSDADTDIPPVLTVAELVAGDLVITEVMRDPDDVSDNDGEWFEVLNATALSIDLEGLIVRDDGGDSFEIDVALVVGPGERVVMANDPGAAGGLVDFDYGSDMQLSNNSDELVLEGSVEIDRMAWDNGMQWIEPRGASMSLDPTATDAVSNDSPTAWCEATSVYGITDRGTPRAANDPC